MSAVAALSVLRAQAAQHLTPRQRDVLEYHIKGYCAGRIAKIIRYSQRTVEAELAVIRRTEPVKEALDDFDLAFLREEGLPLVSHAIVRGGQVINAADTTLIKADRRFHRVRLASSERTAIAVPVATSPPGSQRFSRRAG